MMEVWKWVTAHRVEIMEAVGALYLVASIVVRLTPSPKDDAALGKVRGLLERLSFLAPIDTGKVLTMPGANPRSGGDA
jgi:hypothetical protein